MLQTSMAAALFTIGYEGRELDELIAELSANRVERVIDIRELPLSRRRGFSKTPLGTALAGADIEYVHLRQAGNPYRREKDRSTVLAKYAQHLARAQDALGDVVESARGRRVALLCYEREPGECHRSILARRVGKKLGLDAIDL